MSDVVVDSVLFSSPGKSLVNYTMSRGDDSVKSNIIMPTEGNGVVWKSSDVIGSLLDSSNKINPLSDADSFDKTIEMFREELEACVPVRDYIYCGVGLRADVKMNGGSIDLDYEEGYGGSGFLSMDLVAENEDRVLVVSGVPVEIDDSGIQFSGDNDDHLLEAIAEIKSAFGLEDQHMESLEASVRESLENALSERQIDGLESVMDKNGRWENREQSWSAKP